MFVQIIKNPNKMLSTHKEIEAQPQVCKEKILELWPDNATNHLIDVKQQELKSSCHHDSSVFASSFFHFFL